MQGKLPANCPDDDGTGVNKHYERHCLLRRRAFAGYSTINQFQASEGPATM